MIKILLERYWMEILYLIPFPLYCVVLEINNNPIKLLAHTFIAISVIMVVGALMINTTILNEVGPRFAGSQQFAPSKFFDYMFVECDEETDDICRIEDEVIALQKITQRDNSFRPIPTCIKELEQLYRGVIHKQVVDKGGSMYCDKMREISVEEIKKNILLLRKVLIEEKTGFLYTNGQDSTNFVLNRQNKFTDVVLISIGVPLLIEVLRENINSIGDVWDVLSGNMYVLTSAFVMVLAYRIMKYEKNKLSMMRTNTRLALYHKMEILLDVFECAFDIERE